MIKKYSLILSIIIFLIIILNKSNFLNIFNKIKTPEYYQVKEVIDGDTIILENGHQVRYLGIDAPEISHENVKEECGGKEATIANIDLLKGKRIRLIADQTDKDNYGRLLRYVYTDTGELVNYTLVKQGYAQALDQPPLGKFNNFFFQAQKRAKSEKLGIWKKCFNTSSIKDPELPSKCMSTTESWKHIGDYGCVRYKVNNISYEENRNIWLNETEKVLSGFSATIFPSQFNNFIDNLVVNYKSKTIQVTGNIRMYRNRPLVIIKSPSQLRIIND